jgi:hypothetical protein
MLLFVDYIETKQIIAPALNTIVGGPSKVYEASRAQVTGAIDALVKRAIKSGDIRTDLDPFDLLRALIGVSNVASGSDWPQSARRLVDVRGHSNRPRSDSRIVASLDENEAASPARHAGGRGFAFRHSATFPKSHAWRTASSLSESSRSNVFVSCACHRHYTILGYIILRGRREWRTQQRTKRNC